MKITYFLTGSLDDVDNDFELIVKGKPAYFDTDHPKDFKYHFTVILHDITSEYKLSAEQSGPSFLLCLNDLQEFITRNYIQLHSMVLTSTQRNAEIDHELQRFVSANTNL
ncbi:MAG: hypothetical protein EOP54_05690 [Sphingobacteriales bacterium]|nr:MAG: hypothetical protein EOP54_05690 [Sphingobacteriales bacterium]